MLIKLLDVAFCAYAKCLKITVDAVLLAYTAIKNIAI